MADSVPTPADTVVRGEMQPWTDYEGARRPAGGAVLCAFLDDLLPAGASRTLVVGPHDADVLALVAARSAHVTVLVRSVSDAATLRDTAGPAGVTVVAGALDGLAGVPDTEPYDVVVAADGLDRVLGTDSPAMTWPARAAALTGLAAPDAVLVIGVENEFSLTGVLDRRPLDERHGDDEWRPLHDDPTRPTSPTQVTAALEALGVTVSRQYAVFDPAGRPHTLLDTAAAASTRPGRPGARLAVAGFTATAAHTPLLAPVADGADAATRAGLLDAVAPVWLVVCGTGGDTRTGYAAAASDTVLAVDLDGSGWRISALPGTAPADTGIVVFDPAVLPERVPDTDSAEVLLLRLAAAEDVPAFRRLAARLGDWARTRDGAAVLCFDAVHVDGDGFADGILGWRCAGEASPADLLAAAWHRFADRLVRGHRRHPWPPWMAEGDGLVTTWLAMSGVEVSDAVVKRGREIADAVSTASTSPAVSPAADVPDLRTVLADAETARVKAVELAGRIFGLERTLRFRTQTLKTREQQLRTVRDELRRLKGSKSMLVAQAIRKAGVIRQPKRLAGAVKRRLLK